MTSRRWPPVASTTSRRWLVSDPSLNLIYAVVVSLIRRLLPSSDQQEYGKNAFATGSISPSQITKGLASYQALGIGAERLVVALPWFGSEFLCDCSCPWYPDCSTDDPTHDGGRPVCPSGAPWHGHCPQGCRLNQNKPTPAGPGPDLGIGQALQLLNCSSAQGQWKEPGPPGGVKTLDNTSTTWSELQQRSAWAVAVAESDGWPLLRTVIKVPAGNCRAISDTCKSCCSSCSGGEHGRLRTLILAALRVHTGGALSQCHSAASSLTRPPPRGLRWTTRARQAALR